MAFALDAAHAAKDAWGEKSAAERAKGLNAIADAIKKNKEMLARSLRAGRTASPCMTLAADIPLVVDHFRSFAAAAARRGRPLQPRSTRTSLPTTSASRSVHRQDRPVQLPS